MIGISIFFLGHFLPLCILTTFFLDFLSNAIHCSVQNGHSPYIKAYHNVQPVHRHCLNVHDARERWTRHWWSRGLKETRRCACLLICLILFYHDYHDRFTTQMEQLTHSLAPPRSPQKPSVSESPHPVAGSVAKRYATSSSYRNGHVSENGCVGGTDWVVN